MPLNLRPLLAVLALICIGLMVSPALAQAPPPLTLEVQAGYDDNGRYRVGYWFPVTVVVANDGPDVQGTVEWRFPGTDEAPFRYELDLPRGARKSISLPVVATETQHSASVTLLVAGTKLASVQTRLDPIDEQAVTVGVVSADPALLNSLAAATLADSLTTRVVHLAPKRLPSDAALLAGLNVLFIHDLVTADLTEAQRVALATWTHLGGQLVVGGGARAKQTTPGLAGLLPVTVGELRPNTPTAALGVLAGRDDLANTLATTTASAVTLRPRAVRLDRDSMLTAWDLGAGRVIFASFDLAALRTWAGEADLWAHVLPIAPRMSIGHSLRSRNENLLRDSLNLPAMRLPSTVQLLLMMSVYIVVIGPVNFLVLRRLRRVELAWVTTPLLVVGFTAAAYSSSFILRGVKPQITQLAIVQGFEGQAQGQVTALLGVFSPQRHTYKLDFAPEALVTPGTFESFQFQKISVTSDSATTSVREMLIDVSALRTLLVETPTSAVPTVQSTLTLGSGGEVRGQVRLVGKLPLHDAMLVVGASAQQLGELQPGEQASVLLEANRENFPDQLSLNDGEVINHFRVLNSLFSYDRFALAGPAFQGAKGLPEPDGVYLIAWGTSATSETRIDGDPERQQGETLYLIRLAVGR